MDNTTTVSCTTTETYLGMDNKVYVDSYATNQPWGNGAVFCADCGTSVWPPHLHCATCHKILPKIKECPECGQ